MFFLKNKQALHEIIRASSVSIIFVEFYISPHGCESFQIYGKLQFLQVVLASQNIGSRYFNHMLPNVITLQFCKQNIYHIV